MKIKDAELLKQLTGEERIPVSNGSGKPTAVTVNQILEKVPEPKFIKERISDLETKTVGIENQLSNVYTKSEMDAKILELQTLINNYINGTSQVSELDV